MYRNEIERFNKLIDEKHIYLSSKKSLKEIVREFFSIDYQGISKEQMEKVKLDFEKRFIMTIISKSMKTERYEIDILYEEIERSLDVILDKSVDESKLHSTPTFMQKLKKHQWLIILIATVISAFAAILSIF